MATAPEASSHGAAASRWAASLGGGKEEGGGRRPGKGTCKAVWREDLAVFEVLQPRGDSLKSMVSTPAALSVLFLVLLSASRQLCLRCLCKNAAHHITVLSVNIRNV